jgi:membrane-associated phospholipid phosphatase
MALSLMYFAEHYLIDILAGWALVAGSFWFWGRWERRQGDPIRRSRAATVDHER